MGQYVISPSASSILCPLARQHSDTDPFMTTCASISSASLGHLRANTPTESPLPPMLLATLISALHGRPFQALPMLFPPVLLFSTYLNLSSYTIDAAGLTAAWSGLYLVLARRRKAKTFGSRFGVRGLTRGATLGLALANVVGGGMTYAFGRRSVEEKVRGVVGK